jgi:hypothetical protein
VSAPAADLQLMLTIRTPRRSTEPARELAGKPAQTGTPAALGQACHVAVHAVAVAIELGDAGMHSVKRLPGQQQPRQLNRRTAELSHI